MKRSSLLLVLAGMVLIAGILLFVSRSRQQEFAGRLHLDAAVVSRDCRIISLADQARIPRNFRYPVIEWSGPTRYHGPYLLRLQSASTERNISVTG
ncbi:MAG TPA: hypothetical protein VGM23_08925, partial [Armatimonadota bacterium]